jgi:membrane protein implicated in regulation of membrane protease activity
MKKLLILALAVCVMFTVASFAQDMSQDSGTAKAAPAPLKNIKGTVKADGDKLTFVSDKDKKSWDVVNPETLKGHEGHHVEVSAHVYADKDQIHVMSVKMLKAEKMDKRDNMSK